MAPGFACLPEVKQKELDLEFIHLNKTGITPITSWHNLWCPYTLPKSGESGDQKQSSGFHAHTSSK